MKFGNNLRITRKKAKLSQEELADLMFVSRQTISKWERGNSYPSTHHILMLVNKLECDLEDLVPASEKYSIDRSRLRRRCFLQHIGIYRFIIITAIILASGLFGFCFSFIGKTNSELSSISPETIVRTGLMDSFLSNIFTDNFLDNVFGDSSKYSEKTVLGYGFSDKNKAFYVKCKLCEDNIPSAAIVYFYQKGDHYSYECEYPEDFNYCPDGEYRRIL